MSEPVRISIGDPDTRIALARWGATNSCKPPALLAHGTGFVAEVWDDVARELARDYTVYALDRRGHGDSHKPAADHYHFQDFAEDVSRVVETFDLTNIYGIGHSAGATDLLLAAKLLPGRFKRQFVMEPTVMDPRRRRDGGLSESAIKSVHGVLRRQASFANSEAAFARYRSAAAFADWTETSLRAYVRHGFMTEPDGSVRLRCTPQIESMVLRPIFEAMEQVYTGDARGNPFGWLTEINCPVRVATAEKSWPIYKKMAAHAVSLLPVASTLTFEGIGHGVAQEAPTQLLKALQSFATDT